MTPTRTVRGTASTSTLIPITHGWELLESDPGRYPGPDDLPEAGWCPAAVPGTVAAALQQAGRWTPGRPLAVDDRDWWLRTRFPHDGAGGGCDVLVFDGLATLCEVWLNGERILQSDSMFRRHTIDVTGALREENALVLAIRALRPRLAGRRRPRARWRTRLVEEGNLRFVRTALLGRAPGFAPGPAIAGAYRPVRLERRGPFTLERASVRSEVAPGEGLVHIEVELRAVADAAQATAPPSRVVLEAAERGSGGAAAHRQELALTTDGVVTRATGTLRVPGVRLWWPHTHGSPVLYELRLALDGTRGSVSFDLGRTGFRTLHTGDPGGSDGLRIEINGVAVFARGAVWAGDLLEPTRDGTSLRRTLEYVRAAGMNILRVVGTAWYESDEFHDLCDELGLLLWQDLPFANLDYPEGDAAFMEAVAEEVREQLARLQARPSLVVVCGGSEVAQQVAMLGLDPALAEGPLFGELLPKLVRGSGVDAAYIPSSPWGGPLPFRNDAGVAHYFGVGGYRRGFEDVRRAEVKFASECLALANIPEADALEAGGVDAPPGSPAWKATVPRDTGAPWDFEDVRDHYLERLYPGDPATLRARDPERYLELSRATSGAVMTEVFAEWRRPASPCAGGIVLWLADHLPGSGWGILDHRGRPKPVFHDLRRILAPVTVWLTDEGLSGLAVHLANDTENTRRVRLRVAFYRDGETRVEELERELELPARSASSHDVEGLLGRFVDASWAYRFGAPPHDLVVATLEEPGNPEEPVSQFFHHVLGRPAGRESARALGLRIEARPEGRDVILRLEGDRHVHRLRIVWPGMVPADDWFDLEPGRARRVMLRPDTGARATADGRERPRGAAHVSAVNLRAAVLIDRGDA